MLKHVANKHTFNAFDVVGIVHGPGPIEEADSAGEPLAWCKPLSERDPQPAGDAVMVPFPQGSVVGRHAICHTFLFDLPGHAHVVWVEMRGHTHQGLLVRVVSPVSTLVI